MTIRRNCSGRGSGQCAQRMVKGLCGWTLLQERQNARTEEVEVAARGPDGRRFVAWVEILDFVRS